MKTLLTCSIIVMSVMLVTGSCVVVVRPYECMLLVEKANRMLQDFLTAKYIRDEVMGGTNGVR